VTLTVRPLALQPKPVAAQFRPATTSTSTMHFPGKLVFLLPLASAIPTTDSRHGILQARETCYLHSDAVKFQPLGCDSDPYNGQRKRALGGGDNPVITCWAPGREVSWTFETLGTVKHTRWAYWSSQSCWIWAPCLQDGCTSEFSHIRSQ